MEKVIQLSGKASQVFRFLALLAQFKGHAKLSELK